MTQQQERKPLYSDQTIGDIVHDEALGFAARHALRTMRDAYEAERTAAHAEVERLTQEVAELRRGQYVPVEDGEYSAGKLLVHVLAGRYVIATKATHDDTGQDYWNATSLPNDYRLCRLAAQEQEGDE